MPTATKRSTPGAPVRKGTAHIIREYQPVVVPITLSGFDRAFERKGLRRIGRDVELKIRFDRPLTIEPDDSVERIHEILTDAIVPSDAPPQRWPRPVDDEVRRKQRERPHAPPSV